MTTTPIGVAARGAKAREGVRAPAGHAGSLPTCDPAAGRLAVHWLGRRPFAETERLQAELVRRRREGAVPDTLLLLEHEPVITLGKGASASHVRLSAAELLARGIACHETGRGGDVTFHGPGQLVGYPILALGPGRRDAHRYLRDLEEVLIRAVSRLGVLARRVPGLTGVWVGREKLAAIGVRLSSGWITSHGFSLNVGADLSGFETIVPCGLSDHGVTSLERVTGRSFRLRDVAGRVAGELERVLGHPTRALDDPRRAGSARNHAVRPEGSR